MAGLGHNYDGQADPSHSHRDSHTSNSTRKRDAPDVRDLFLLFIVALASISAGLVGVPPAAAQRAPDSFVERLAGPDRYATSLEVARAYADERGGKLDSAVLVSGTSWPDAVMATGLAGLLDGPILLVSPSGLSDGALEFLEGVGVSELIAVGSESVLPSEALAAARRIDPDIERISAADRYTASVAVARRMGAGGHGFGSARTVIVANGDVFVDGMVAGTFAARGTHPVLLTPGDRLHPAVGAFIRSDLVERVVIMGGHAAVSAEVEAAVDPVAKHVVRLAGATRFETAVAVADYLRDRYSWTAGGECFSDEIVGLTTARAPYDAFTAGPLLGRLCAPLLLTDPAAVPEASAQWLGPDTNQLIVLGGSAAVSQQAVSGLVAERGIGGRAQAEAYMVTLVNELRAGFGVEPLRHHAGLRRVARGWSEQIPEDGRFGHNPDWLDEYPLGWHLYGENVAREYVAGTLDEAVKAAFEGFRDSPPHFSNTVNPEFTDVGIGIAVGERKIMVTHNFSSYPVEPVEVPPTKPRLSVSAWADRFQLRWESTTSDLPITHWQIDDGGLPGDPPASAWGYMWHDPPQGIHRVLAAACNAAGCSEPSAYTFTIGDGEPAPGTPLEPSVSVAIDGSRVTVSWHADTDASTIESWTYHLEREDSVRLFHEYLPVAQRQREHYSLGPGTYVVYVLGHNAHGPGAWARAEFTVAER
ncbi:cell wall-binding repeat-containing protein [Candidatus Poriferisodalis sp.]|uniref:cell wall-binding repeat-containing protein n=1 Tax=Candidatus Poriferisodalis sp. TaxID=3101277 RepID=UPI003AF9F048